MELRGGTELWGFRVEKGGESGRGGEVDFWGFSGVGLTEMSTNWTGVVDVGEDEQSESEQDGVVDWGMTDVAVAEDILHI